jgi:tryptophan halogenase
MDSWIMVMLGQGVRPESYHHVARMMEAGQLQKALADLKSGIAHEVAKLPDHRQFVQRYAPATA